MEIRVSKIPPMCVVGVVEGVGSDQYLSHGLLVLISFSPHVAWAAVHSKAVVLLLLTCCLLLIPLWESVIVLCFVVRYFKSFLVLQSS